MRLPLFGANSFCSRAMMSQSCCVPSIIERKVAWSCVISFMAASPYRPPVYDIRCSLQPVDAISLQSVGHAIFQGLVERKAPARRLVIGGRNGRSEEHTSELQSLM